jgi:hypothetical protein
MPGDAMERVVEVLGLGVLFRTTDCSAAANAGDDINGGDFRAADGVEGKWMDGIGGGGGGGGGGADVIALAEDETIGDSSWIVPVWVSSHVLRSTLTALETVLSAHLDTMLWLADASACVVVANPPSSNSVNSALSIHLKLITPSNTARPARIS